MESTASRIAAQLQPGMRIAIADGAGAPTSLVDDLTEAAASVGDISLILGWCLDLPVRLDRQVFRDIRTVMGGFALRDAIGEGTVRYVPERLSAVPALLRGPLRPDILVLAMARDATGWAWGTEVAWMPSVIESGVMLLIEHNDALPRTSLERGLPLERGVAVSRAESPPLMLPAAAIDEVAERIGRRIAALVPERACLQYGPGQVADALFAALSVPVHVRSGMVTDAVLDLERRGLLLGDPVSAYVAGGPELYEWADGRRITTRVEKTHDLAVAGQTPFVTVNSALEVDLTGQVNVQGAGGRQLSGIGGHSDFALAGHRSIGGLSVIATPTSRGGRSTLVQQLSGPASTPRSDVDVVVTELGTADLRGLDDGERASELRRIWTTT